MTTAIKIFKIACHSDKHLDLGEIIEAEPNVFINYAFDYYGDNEATFVDGSVLLWNYKNECEVLL